jgi:hypothetical protein
MIIRNALIIFISVKNKIWSGLLGRGRSSKDSGFYPKTLVHALTPATHVASGIHPPEMPTGSNTGLTRKLGLPSPTYSTACAAVGAVQVQVYLGSLTLVRVNNLISSEIDGETKAIATSENRRSHGLVHMLLHIVDSFGYPSIEILRFLYQQRSF